MTAQALATHRFVRRTQLGPNEYRKNFQQIDRDIIAALTSHEACRVTPLMSKIYLCLANAPARFWEREGVLRFESEVSDERRVKAWTVLCELVGVASATASKALAWMREQGIIGYFAGKNGVGIRVFLNRAASSIGTRPAAAVQKTARAAGEKILPFARASSLAPPASTDEPAFNDSFAVLESSDSEKIRRAPESGAGETRRDETTPDPEPRHASAGDAAGRAPAPSPPVAQQQQVPVGEIVRRVVAELEPSLREAASMAAAREHERTREWLETRGLPKAARVAQREAFNVLRQHGARGLARGVSNFAAAASSCAPGGSDVAGSHGEGEGGASASASAPLSEPEVAEWAEACVSMLLAQGRPIAETLAGLSGGALGPEDASRVRRLAERLAGEASADGGGN